MGATRTPSAAELAAIRSEDRNRMRALAEPGHGKQQLAESDRQQDEVEARIARTPANRGGA